MLGSVALRITVSILSITAAVLLACSGSGEDSARTDRLEVWADAICSSSVEFETQVFGALAAAEDQAAPGSGREGIVRYARSIREVETLSRELSVQASEVPLPPDDVLPFHLAQLATYDAFTENIALFAADMEAFLAEDDFERLDRAYPDFIAREDSRIEALIPVSIGIPRDGGAALDAVSDCPGLQGEELSVRPGARGAQVGRRG